MATLYDIDLLRGLFEYKLNDATIKVKSFYEQIEDAEQLDRFVEEVREMIALQNQEKSVSNFKAHGIIRQQSQAEIINIKTNYISPLEYEMRLDLEPIDRDYVLDKVKTLIDNLRGLKFDVVLLDNGQVKVIESAEIDTSLDKKKLNKTFLFFVPLSSYDPTLSAENTTFSSDISTQFVITPDVVYVLYMIYNNRLYTRTYRKLGFAPGTVTIGAAQDLGLIKDTYKISLSFNGIQTNEPYINNGADRVNIFFSGSATIVQSKVSLGNDIVLTSIQAGKNTGTLYIVEPTEIPASLSLNDDTFPLYSTGYQSIDRNLSISNKINYSFVYDSSNALYNAMYRYARFGKAVGDSTALDPNAIYTIKEYRQSYGVVTIDKIYAKINDIGTSNTNGDVMTITCGFKVGAY
jgi:hypothetical protein